MPQPFDVPIRDESIRLGQFLKLANLVESWAEAKPLIADGLVRVNDEVETRRGRQLVPGDVVSLAGQAARVAEGVDGHDGAVLHELLARSLADDLLDPDAPEDLHRPLADLSGSRVDGGPAMVLSDNRADAMVGKQQPARHADETAADDNYVD